MKKTLLLAMLAMISLNCGIDMEHSGKTQVEISLDKRVESYFEAKCRQSLPGYPEEAIAQCRDIAVAEFLEDIQL